jgi:hypothetical protein
MTDATARRKREKVPDLEEENTEDYLQSIRVGEGREEDTEESDDFMPFRQKRKKLSLSKAKPTRDLAPSPGYPTLSASTNISELNGDVFGSVVAPSGATSKDVASPGDGGPRTPPHQICYSVSENHKLLERLRDEKQLAKSSLEPICSNIIDTTNKHMVKRPRLDRDYHLELVINDATKYIDELIERSH